jgi:hypothetical protein
MNRKKQEEVSFVSIMFGLILGFILGAGLVYRYYDKENEIQLINKISSFVSSFFDKPAFTKDSLIPANPLAGKSTPTSAPKSPGKDQKPFSTDVTLSTEPNISEEDFQLTDFEYMDLDSLEVSDFTEFDVFRVIHDSLALVRSFYIPLPQSQARPEQYRLLDSLLGSSRIQKPGYNLVNIEFWISPIHYTGYKKSKNRIIIYGIDQPDQAEFFMSGTDLIMKYFDQAFLLSDNASFQPFRLLHELEDLD